MVEAFKKKDYREYNKKRMKILITGGLGFIGSYLAEKCIAAGHSVTIISKTDNKLNNIVRIKDKVNLIIKDVKEVGEEVKGFDYIFHLAGSTDNYAIIEGKPYRDIEMNCTSTIALLEAVRKYNPKARIIFASTFFVNGRLKKLPATPDSACNPLGLYGATRLAAEHFCQIYCNVFDLDIVIARFCNVFGANERSNDKKKAGFNYLINLAVNNKEIPMYGNGNFYRDYIYVTDVVEACWIIAEKGDSNRVYYVGRGEFVKFKEIIAIVAKETNSIVKSVLPPDFHKRVGIKDFVCDNSELIKLGWKPAISLREGIKLTIRYYKQNAHN
jgi:UDP-glucose 4-epimerase